MGNVLGKIRTTLQNPTTTFNIGFNNRTPNPLGRKSSPLNAYSLKGSKYSKDWTPSIPTVNWEPSDFDPDPTGKVINAEVGKVLSMGNIVGNMVKMGGKITDDTIKRKEEEKLAAEEKEKANKPKYKLGSFAHQTMDPEGYEKHLEWKKQEAINEEKAKREQEVEEKRKEAHIPDFSNITGTTDDLDIANPGPAPRSKAGVENWAKENYAIIPAPFDPAKDIIQFDAGGNPGYQPKMTAQWIGQGNDPFDPNTYKGVIDHFTK